MIIKRPVSWYENWALRNNFFKKTNDKKTIQNKLILFYV